MSVIKPKNLYEKKIKIGRFLSREEICSRSEAEQLALEGFLFVNNIAVQDVEKRIDPKTDKVEIRKTNQRELELLLAIHKPSGIVSQIMKSDVRPANSLISVSSYAHFIKGMHKDADWVEKNKKQFYPLGSLEKEAEGLLLLTNQKSLLKRLTQFEIYLEREFLIQLDKPLHPKNLSQMYKGTLMHGYLIKPLAIKVEPNNMLRITVLTDYKNQLFQILGKAGVRPLHITCTRIGKFKLGSLKPSQWLIINNAKDVIKKVV